MEKGRTSLDERGIRADAQNPTAVHEKARWRWALGLVLLLIVAGALGNAIFGDRGLIGLLKARHELEEFEKKIAAINAENERLLVAIRALKTDPFAVEKVARENFGLVKPGEIVLILKKSR